MCIFTCRAAHTVEARAKVITFDGIKRKKRMDMYIRVSVISGWFFFVQTPPKVSSFALKNII